MTIFLYGDDQKEDSEKFGESLKDNGNIVHMIYVEDADDFYNGWSSMGMNEDGQEVSIDTVYINLHGEPEHILSSNNQEIYVSKLEIKTIDTILLTACNTGNTDFNNNFANQLAMSQNVDQVIAPDGLGYRLTYFSYKSEYFPEYSGVERKGNGFVLYQNIQNSIQITPDLTNDNEVVFLSKLLSEGRFIGEINSIYSTVREDNNTMNLQQLLNNIVGL